MMTLVSVATYSESRAQKVIPLSLVWEWQSIVGGSVFCSGEVACLSLGGGEYTDCPPPPPPNLERLLRAPLFNLDTSVNGYDNTLVSQPAFWMGKGHASSIPPPPPPPQTHTRRYGGASAPIGVWAALQLSPVPKLT